jgi:hypothetical protein
MKDTNMIVLTAIIALLYMAFMYHMFKPSKHVDED